MDVQLRVCFKLILSLLAMNVATIATAEEASCRDAPLVSGCLIANNDSDGDGILDQFDNCRLVPNADQKDNDRDGYGDLCDADINADGIVNAVDLGLLRLAFFSNPEEDNWNPEADLDGDLEVNNLDLAILRSRFFKVPGPSVSDCQDVLDVTDHGLVANDESAAAANSIALQALVSPGNSSYTNKTIVFPGKSTYHFDDMIPIQTQTQTSLDLRGSTLALKRLAKTEDIGTGFFHALRNFLIENGKIVVDYTYEQNCAAFTNNGPVCESNPNCKWRLTNADTLEGLCRPPIHAGAALMFGTRASVGSEKNFIGVFDNDLPYRMGEITVRNVEVSTNNDVADWSTRAVYMLGGLRNVCFDRLAIDGNGVVEQGIAYEFGAGVAANSNVTSQFPNGTPAQSSHAHRILLQDVSVRNISQAAPPVGGEIAGVGLAVRFGGAYDIDVNGLFVDGAYTGFSADSGEAAFYYPWNGFASDPDPVPNGENREIRINDVTMRNVALAISLSGSGEIRGGYLGKCRDGNSEPECFASAYVPNPTAADQTDQLTHIVNGIDLIARANAPSDGVRCQGRSIFLNGESATHSGLVKGFDIGIRAGVECTQIDIENVDILESGRIGLQLGWAPATAFYDPIRGFTGRVSNSSIVDSGFVEPNHAISGGYMKDFTIEGNLLGTNPGPNYHGHAVKINSTEGNDRLCIRDNEVIGTELLPAAAFWSIEGHMADVLFLENNNVPAGTLVPRGGPWNTTSGCPSN